LPYLYQFHLLFLLLLLLLLLSLLLLLLLLMMMRLLLFLLLPWLLSLVPVTLPPALNYLPAVIAWLLGMTWPLFRGMARGQWFQALGLHRGQGLWREMGAGLIGWLAALPLMALSLIASTAISRYTGVVPSHPIVDYFAGTSWTQLTAVILAVIWAPVSEEIMFRGLLFPGLSARLRWLLGMLLGAFIFAVIHPQGWAGVPPIMTLAATFSLLRLWRQSLIAPMTAHAINNGSVCLLMLLM
jgi:membrane protease YdiL (CAAX protease family)